METSSPPPPEAAPRREKLRLKVVEGNAAGTVIEVEDELVIGRLTEGDGTLASDVEISRRHARISADSNGSFGIEDLGSTNGTYVNGRRLEGRAILEAGDRIALGASALVVQVGSAAAHAHRLRHRRAGPWQRSSRSRRRSRFASRSTPVPDGPR